ncbi:two-partner secretion domain-containing protein [Baaleninema simplex]|uniref:two-partner secretion domain-containing protein n=1 Tax=Baaleninema simplex TaxID=2862350 RepID=UPI00034520D7|nr:filamentous hemagglutinin N-terminal domain-containing protein [Baaleninema simplex]
MNTLRDRQPLPSHCCRIALAPILASWLLTTDPALGQILPDATLPENSRVTVEGNTYTLEGGTQAGGNLFHSFEYFSIPTGAEAFFNNATAIDNILTRVTGDNISNLDGLIRANGTANLFLLNPNGIVFGENARLDIGGSFFATTAERLVFEDGFSFDTVRPGTPALLTVSVPVGVQFGANPGIINVSGSGQPFEFPLRNGLFFSPEMRSRAFVETRQDLLDTLADPTGLQVDRDRTLALVANDLHVEGGRLTAESGRIELGSVAAESTVNLAPHPDGWQLDYSPVAAFADLTLSQQAWISTTGATGGDIVLQGRQIDIVGDTNVISATLGAEDGGSVNVRGRVFHLDQAALEASSYGTGNAPTLDIVATDAVRLTGTAFALTDAYNVGNGSTLTVETGTLGVLAGANLRSVSFGSGRAGDIIVNASESIAIAGTRSPSDVAIISSTATDRGATGNLAIATGTLDIRGGAQLSALNFGTGRVGNVTVEASESVRVSGRTPNGNLGSGIFAQTVGPTDSGQLAIASRRVSILNGAQVSTTTFGGGRGGNLTIAASESLEVSGTFVGDEDTVFNSGLFAATGRIGGFLPGFDVAITGDGGSLSVSAGQLRVEGGGKIGATSIDSQGKAGNLSLRVERLEIGAGSFVTVRNEGLEDAGSIFVEASDVRLSGNGELTASTASGQGGNVTVRARESLQLRDDSTISAEAGGAGNGGNVRLQATSLVLLDNSTITANAIEGAGGNIQIETQGLFVAPESRITASSQLGVRGVIRIAEPELDTSAGLVELSDEPIDPTTRLTSTCAADEGNTFIVTGNGGLPPDPTQMLHGQTVWEDLRLTEISGRADRSPATEIFQHDDRPLVEATGWHLDETGTVELVARPPTGDRPFRLPSCASFR